MRKILLEANRQKTTGKKLAMLSGAAPEHAALAAHSTQR